MAGNEWINGYLEAILDAGSSGSTRKRDDGKFQEKLILKVKVKQEEKLFSPTKYFVEEVINSFDESDLHRTWVKVSFTYLSFFFLFF